MFDYFKCFKLLFFKDLRIGYIIFALLFVDIRLLERKDILMRNSVDAVFKTIKTFKCLFGINIMKKYSRLQIFKSCLIFNHGEA